MAEYIENLQVIETLKIFKVILVFKTNLQIIQKGKRYGITERGNYVR